MKKILLLIITSCLIFLVMNANTTTAEFHNRGDEVVVTGVTTDEKVYFNTDYILTIGDESVALLHMKIVLDIENDTITHYSIQSQIIGGSQVRMSDELIDGKEISGLLEISTDKGESYDVHYDKETYNQLKDVENIKNLKVVNNQIHFETETGWRSYYDISFTLDSFDELKGRISVK